jgi:proteic killer suppression protein
MAGKIAQRISEISNAPDVTFIVRYHVGNCHPLHGDRKSEFAMDLVQPFRLVFIEKDKVAHLVRITSIEDYH